MKTIFILSALVVLSIHSFGQANNPYNQRGIDYVTSLKMISSDYQSGRVTSLNQESIDYYSRTIPLQVTVSTDLVASIVKTIKAPGFNLVDFIGNCKASAFVKKSLIDLYNNSQNLKTRDFHAYLSSAAEAIKASRVSEEEKEIVLTNLAFADNASRSPCTIQGGGGGSIPMGTGTCAILGAIGGFVTGLEICGIWCGVGGAIIGAVVFSLC